MPFKKHTPEEIIGKLREAEIVLAQGGTTTICENEVQLETQRLLDRSYVVVTQRLLPPNKQWSYHKRRRHFGQNQPCRFLS